jgi:hypothetical protein
MAGKRKFVIAASTTILLVVAIIVGVRKAKRSFFYPEPVALPPVVSQTTEELLAHLQSVLERRAPHISATLQPGASNERIQALENRGGFRLSDEVKALYRWHDGMSTNSTCELFPMGYFQPLGNVVDEKIGLENQVNAGTPMQRAAFNTFAGHTKPWVSIFPDGAGDGYYFDPQRNSFFYHFAETGSYHWFPSFKNFLAGLVECYEAGAFFSTNSTNGVTLDQDVEKAQKIWNRFGASNHPE